MNIYIDLQQVNDAVRAHLEKNGIQIKPYEQVFSDLKTLSSNNSKVFDLFTI